MSHLLSIIGKLKTCLNASSISHELLSLDIAARLSTDSDAIEAASTDFGNIIVETPTAVLYPSTINDILDLIKLSYNTHNPFTIAPRGHGHSVRGQAMARNGVVVNMNSLKNNYIRVSWDSSLGFYADVGGEKLWIDVLNATLVHGLAPVSWTDYLYLTVGGTLSNAGISGQTFRYGPQISNVYEMDVITGKGEFVTCSEHKNSELFFAVLGGLGQFGIITRARILLEKAPTREIQILLEELKFIPGFIFTRDATFMDFLNRVRSGEVEVQSKGLWDVPHPWLNLFVPKSTIMDFNVDVFVDIILRQNKATGPILVYPTTRNKWDERMSAVIPEEDIFYCVGLLYSSGFDDWEVLDGLNEKVLKHCNKKGLKIKHYLPYYKIKED